MSCQTFVHPSPIAFAASGTVRSRRGMLSPCRSFIDAFSFLFFLTWLMLTVRAGYSPFYPCGIFAVFLLLPGMIVWSIILCSLEHHGPHQALILQSRANALIDNLHALIVGGNDRG